ncbi:hypothetical protein [Bradyrhizobium lablabi]|nr:hypothetical protein [Bradyrhizobium lablabi]
MDFEKEANSLSAETLALTIVLGSATQARGKGGLSCQVITRPRMIIERYS